MSNRTLADIPHPFDLIRNIIYFNIDDKYSE
jgi:hypothetical protein